MLVCALEKASGGDVFWGNRKAGNADETDKSNQSPRVYEEVKHGVCVPFWMEFFGEFSGVWGEMQARGGAFVYIELYLRKAHTQKPLAPRR